MRKAKKHVSPKSYSHRNIQHVYRMFSYHAALIESINNGHVIQLRATHVLQMDCHILNPLCLSFLPLTACFLDSPQQKEKLLCRLAMSRLIITATRRTLFHQQEGRTGKLLSHIFLQPLPTDNCYSVLLCPFTAELTALTSLASFSLAFVARHPPLASSVKHATRYYF